MQGIHNDLSWVGHHRWEKSMNWSVLYEHFSHYLTSLVPICCRISCLSSSDVRCKMFLSSSSFFDGLLPSLIARVSLRRILLAKAPEDWKRQKRRERGFKQAALRLPVAWTLNRVQTKFFIHMREWNFN